MSYITEILLQLKDKNIKYEENFIEEKVIKGVKTLCFKAKLSYNVKECPNCHQENREYSIVKNGIRTSKISLMAMSGLSACLLLSKQRYYCRHCHKSFTAKTTVVDPHSCISNRLKAHVVDLLTTTASEKHIAKLMNVSVHTVRRLADKAAENLRPSPLDTLPKHISLDEFKSTSSVDAAMSCVCIDNDTHQIIDIIADRKLSSLKAYFMRFSLEARSNVQTITTDLYTPYMTLAQDCFPNAKVILDPFHIVQSLNREFNRYRIHVMNTYRTSDRPLYNKFKRYWKLLLACEEKLLTSQDGYYKLFKYPTNSGAIVDYLLETNSTLQNTYYCMQWLRTALKNRDFDEFTSLLQQFKHISVAPGMNRVLRTFRKQLHHLKNTFIFKSLSNGPIEGINNKIKVLKRSAYGYRNFNHFRNRILLMSSLYICS